MGRVSYPTTADVQLCIDEMGLLSTDDLLKLVFPDLERVFLAGGYSAESPWDAFLRWYRETFLPACNRAGDKGAGILKILADPNSAADLATLKMITDFAIDYTNIATAPQLKLAIGAAILIVYCSRLEKGNSLGPPS